MAVNYRMDQERRAKQFAPFAALTGMDEYLTKAEEHEYTYPENQMAVPVIASINMEGKMVPLWFRYHGEKVKIEDVVWSIEKSDWFQYRCHIINNGQKRLVDLIYHRNVTTWTMRK